MPGNRLKEEMCPFPLRPERVGGLGCASFLARALTPNRGVASWLLKGAEGTDRRVRMDGHTPQILSGEPPRVDGMGSACRVRHWG